MLSRSTDRLEIRPLIDKDFEAWQRALSSMSPRKQSPWDIERRSLEFLSEERFELLLQSQESDREEDLNYELSVFLNHSTLIGLVSLMDVVRGVFQNAFVGYRIYNGFWGKGFGTEATRALMDVAFKDLNLHRLEAAIDPSNSRSISIAQALGFRFETLSPKRIYFEGQWRDMNVYAATSEDFGLEWQS